jgi:hypothetical protein
MLHVAWRRREGAENERDAILKARSFTDAQTMQQYAPPACAHRPRYPCARMPHTNAPASTFSINVCAVPLLCRRARTYRVFFWLSLSGGERGNSFARSSRRLGRLPRPPRPPQHTPSSALLLRVGGAGCDARSEARGAVRRPVARGRNGLGSSLQRGAPLALARAELWSMGYR